MYRKWRRENRKNWEKIAKVIMDKPDEGGVPRFRSIARAKKILMN